MNKLKGNKKSVQTTYPEKGKNGVSKVNDSKKANGDHRNSKTSLHWLKFQKVNLINSSYQILDTPNRSIILFYFLHCGNLDVRRDSADNMITQKRINF